MCYIVEGEMQIEGTALSSMGRCSRCDLAGRIEEAVPTSQSRLAQRAVRTSCVCCVRDCDGCSSATAGRLDDRTG